MLTRSATRIATPITFLLSASLLQTSLAASCAPFTMAAQDVAASGSVTGAEDASKTCIVDAEGFVDPTLKKSRGISLALESKWQGEGVGAR